MRAGKQYLFLRYTKEKWEGIVTWRAGMEKAVKYCKFPWTFEQENIACGWGIPEQL